MEKHGLRQSAEGRLILGQALVRSLEILHMAQLELAAFIEQEIEKNPVLELEAGYVSSHVSSRDLPEPLAEISLHDHLTRQVRETFTLPWEFRVAEEWISSLDEKGFVSTSVEEVAARFGLAEEEVAKLLKQLQAFDPPGIFGRNVRETFLLQLERRGEQESLAYRILAESYDDLLHKRYGELIKRYKTGAKELKEAIRLMARLSCRPAACFQRVYAQPIREDLRLFRVGTKWVVEAVDEVLPKVKLRDEYLGLTDLSAGEKEAMRQFTQSAKWLIRSLAKRKKFILELGLFLVKKQSAFLHQKGPLVPISAADLAERFGVHESTISRALAEKYLGGPNGVIRLGDLVPSVSNEVGKELLQRLVAGEDKSSPLTDEELAIHMQKAGCCMARRTVAKYRKQLNIGSASARKHLG